MRQVAGGGEARCGRRSVVSLPIQIGSRRLGRGSVAMSSPLRESIHRSSRRETKGRGRRLPELRSCCGCCLRRRQPVALEEAACELPPCSCKPMTAAAMDDDQEKNKLLFRLTIDCKKRQN